jgi:protein ImuB
MSDSGSSSVQPYFACLHPLAVADDGNDEKLIAIAREYSPRYERHGHDRLVIDVSGLRRLLGPPQVIAEELRDTAASRGVRAAIAIAPTYTAALLLASARSGVTVVDSAEVRDAVAALPMRVLRHVAPADEARGSHAKGRDTRRETALRVIEHWGLKTLGELAALPAAALTARLGPVASGLQAMARGEDVRPLVPDLPDERFESAIELEWPVDGLEPLSFVLTRLLEPLSTRLERRDRGAAALYVELGLIDPHGEHRRRLELPTPMRDVRALRTLALLDLESHPPAAAVDRVRVVIDPTPARVVQQTLFTRAHPTPEQLSTLIARLGALMGQDRIGTPATVDSYRPGIFTMRPFPTVHEPKGSCRSVDAHAHLTNDGCRVKAALRRCRQPVPARVAVGPDARPMRVTTDRRGFTGGSVVRCVGPWRSSGDWWSSETCPAFQAFDRDEWDVALSDGVLYRIFRDRTANGWFIDAVID